MSGEWGRYTSDDGASRPFDPHSADPRTIIATTLAKSSGWVEIRPGHWAEAGRVAAALRAKGQLVDRRRRGQRTARGK